MSATTSDVNVKRSAASTTDSETRRLRRRIEKRYQNWLDGKKSTSRPFRRKEYYEKIVFFSTNETLTQIVEGLAPTPQDTILAVCGSGDQSFALAECGAKVIAIDNNPAQIEYSTYRANLLRKAKYFEFLTLGMQITSDCWPLTQLNNMDYLAKMPRLRAMRENVEDIEFHVGDIFDRKTYPATGYTKIYLSNAYTYGDNHRHEKVHAIAAMLPQDGLLYSASPLYASSMCCGLEIDRPMRDMNCWITKDGWSPIVYRKISKKRAPHKGRRAI